MQDRSACLLANHGMIAHRRDIGKGYVAGGRARDNRAPVLSQSLLIGGPVLLSDDADRSTTHAQGLWRATACKSAKARRREGQRRTKKVARKASVGRSTAETAWPGNRADKNKVDLREGEAMHRTGTVAIKLTAGSSLRTSAMPWLAAAGRHAGRLHDIPAVLQYLAELSRIRAVQTPAGLRRLGELGLLMADERFWESLIVTFTYFFVVLTIELVLGMLLALLLDSDERGFGLLRALLTLTLVDTTRDHRHDVPA